jgi:ubiquinone/menaquinone biosynthesis C-methylase UbiE
MTVEERVAEHYGRPGLERAILDAVIASGKKIDRLVPSDLSPVDEFHIGGRDATVEFAGQLGTARGSHLLDIGSGIGGPSRHFAQEYGCRVSGIDLTAEYVRVATSLARRVGLGDMVDYRVASAAALPFAPRTFDGAYMLHVGMNVQDKASVFASVRRILRPGAVFGIYDVMRDGEGELRFPVPWASKPALSFVDTPATYRTLLEGAGFIIVKERNRRDFAVQFFQQMSARSAQNEPPALGLQVLMGADSQLKIANMIANLEAGLISPSEIIARLPA